MRKHQYFEKSSSKWNINDFLEECDLEPYHRKIEAYTTSLEFIANKETGKRSNKASQLLNNYKEASIILLEAQTEISGVVRFFDNPYNSKLRVEPQSEC
jgi:hypothetical protein